MEAAQKKTGPEVKLKSRDTILLAMITVVICYNACDGSSGFSAKKFNQTGMSSSITNPLSTPTPIPKTYLTDKDAFNQLPQGASQLAVLCSRKSDDLVRKAFCGANAPTVASLVDLQQAIGLSLTKQPFATFALTGHSSSLVRKFVSAINPRAIIFSAAGSDFVAMGFVRGEKLVEIAAGDPKTGTTNFYLVKFNKACDGTDSCVNADNLTPDVEKNWTDISVYEDEDLKNTIMDCRQCHQPNGPGTRKILRMQELELPWTHWMETGVDGGKALLADFHAAHGKNEDYAGIPAAMIDYSNPPALQALLQLIGDDQLQPNLFNSSLIEAEVKASSSAQPYDNSMAGVSATWNLIYGNYLNGIAIAPPYHDVKISDPAKLPAFTQNYVDVMAGLKPRTALIDIREIFPDDRTKLSEMGLAPKPGLKGQALLINACSQCHNSKLDQTIDRAKFNVNSKTFTAKQKQEAIDRLKQPKDALKLMPPRLFMSLTEDEIQELVTYITNAPTN